MNSHAALATTASILVALPLAAGPLEPGEVPADASWVLHVDVEHARATTLGRIILDHTAEPEHDFDIEVDLDPEDLVDLTAFGWEDDEDGIILIESFRMEHIVEQIQAMPNYETFKVDGRTVHSWVANLECDDARDMFATVAPRDNGAHQAVVADSIRSLTRTLRVHNNAAPSCADENASVQTSPEPGAILFFSASDPDKVAQDGFAGLGDADEMRFEFGEWEERAFAALAVSAKDADTARDIADILQGVALILGAVVPDDDPQITLIRETVKSMRFVPEGRTIHSRCEVDAHALCGPQETN